MLNHNYQINSEMVIKRKVVSRKILKKDVWSRGDEEGGRGSQ